jgi:hypothetical protein
VIAVSHAVKREIHREYPDIPAEPVLVVHNGVDTNTRNQTDGAA